MKLDVVFAPLSGQNADPSRDKGGIRVYWIADAKAAPPSRRTERRAAGVPADAIARLCEPAA